MESTELAAHLFRTTQMDEKLRRGRAINKAEANQTHYLVGKRVRRAIKELDGTIPENLSTPGKSIKQIEAEHRKQTQAVEDKPTR